MLSEKERRRAHYVANREKILADRKAYYAANRDKVRERVQTYRERNQDAVRSSQKKYNEQNRARRAEYARDYRRRKPAALVSWQAANKDHLKESKRLERVLYPSRVRARRLKRVYGLTLDRYHQMLEEQNYTCAVCRGSFGENEVPHVDHCHATGKVRGILHGNCNLAIGLLRDSGAAALSAGMYLLKHKRTEGGLLRTLQ